MTTLNSQLHKCFSGGNVGKSVQPANCKLRVFNLHSLKCEMRVPADWLLLIGFFWWWWLCCWYLLFPETHLGYPIWPSVFRAQGLNPPRHWQLDSCFCGFCLSSGEGALSCHTILFAALMFLDFCSTLQLKVNNYTRKAQDFYPSMKLICLKHILM